MRSIDMPVESSNSTAVIDFFLIRWILVASAPAGTCVCAVYPSSVWAFLWIDEICGLRISSSALRKLLG